MLAQMEKDFTDHGYFFFFCKKKDILPKIVAFWKNCMYNKNKDVVQLCFVSTKQKRRWN